ncbi:MAG: TonB-dependent receptor [Gemmatimonadales bacterium]|nr:TonB-dependent receptor [Gemmatimonadales bacterium]
MPLSRPTLLVGACLVAAPLAAQQRPTAQRPDSAKRDSSAVQLTPLEVVGTIQPFAGPKIGSGVPGNVSIITGEALEGWEPRMLTDMLTQQPGISTYDDLGSPYKMNLQYRGFFASPVVGIGQGLAIFLDGARQNEPDAAQVNWDLLPMEHVKRVEVLPGTASLLGRNAIGGAINLVTRRGESATPSGTVEASGGRFGRFAGNASISQRLGSGWDYYVGGGYNREAGWRQVTRGEQANGFVNVGRETADGGIRFQLYAARSKAFTAGSLPFTVYAVRPDSNLSANDYEDLMNVQGSVAGFRRVGTGRISANLYVRRHSADRFNVSQPADPDFFSSSRNTIAGGTLDYRWGGLLGGREVGLRVGVDGSAASTNVEIFQDETKFPGGGRDLTTRVSAPVVDGAGFALGDIRFGRLLVSAGARYDVVRVPFRNELNSALSFTQTFTQFNPKAGLALDAGGGLSLFGSAGRSFRAPAVIEMACVNPATACPLPFALGDDKAIRGAANPGDPVRPVRASTYEAGLKLERAAFTASVTAYRTDLRDEIILLPNEAAPAGSTIEGIFTNIDRTRRQGVETALNYVFGNGIAVFANWSYTRATFESEAELFSPRADEELGIENEVEPGDRLPLVPDHQLKGGITWPVARGVVLGLQGRYVGRQFLRGDEANDDRQLNGYFIADARATVTRGRWELNTVVNNVLDNRYAVFGTYNVNQGNPRGNTLERFLTPGMPLVARVMVRWAFGQGDD